MENQVVWQERFNIGVEVIDKEHRKLFGILGRMLSNKQQDEKSKWVYQEGIKYFKEHAMKHFAEEEVYMASISYEGFEAHRRVHDNFRKKTLPALERELNQSDYSEEAVSHFLGVCAGWLIGHTLTEDRAITGKSGSRWRKLMPEEEQTAMKEMILHLLNDMFGLNARVISDCYGGEKFGKGIYYRLVYGGNQGEKWEILLVFEEKLLLNTIGSIIDTQSDEVDVMVMNATRYTARQFVERISKQFLNVDVYKVTEESLLNYEQFQEKFEGHHPQFSLLFDTGQGYFAYCVVAPHLLPDENGTSIEAENAMAKVKSYLNKSHANRNQAQKQKILVVDDSELMRLAMKELLEKDYEITTADSGLSAIRSITLDRPDLVLLDYEMPICDGSQVLGMIRSEKDFEDIPVIFLTSRMDKESVHKVISLKPSGYLLKTLSPEKIKKEVDDFFKKKSS